MKTLRKSRAKGIVVSPATSPLVIPVSSVNNNNEKDNIPEYLYSISYDKSLRIWNKDNGASIAVLQGHEYPINCIAMATDFIFTGDSNGSIFVWSKWKQNVVGKFQHKDAVYSLHYANNHLYSCSFDKTIAMWNMADINSDIPVTPALITQEKDTPQAHNWFVTVHSYPIKKENVTEVSQKIISLTSDGSLQIFKEKNGKKIQTILPSERLTCTTMDQHGVIYAGTWNGNLKVWAPIPSQPSFGIKHSASVRVTIVDESQIYTGTQDGLINVYNKFTKLLLYTLRGHSRAIRCLIIDGNRLISGSEDQTIRLWNKQTGVLVGGPILNNNSESTNRKSVIIGVDLHSVNCLAVDESYIYSGSEGSYIRVYDKETLACRYKWDSNSGEPIIRIEVDKGRILINCGFNIRVIPINHIKSPTPESEKTIIDLSHDQRVACFQLSENQLYVGTATEDKESYKQLGKITVWKESKFGQFSSVTTVNTTKGAPFCLHVKQGRIYVGTAKGYVGVRNAKNVSQILQVIKIHPQWIYTLFVDEGKVYTGSFDRYLSIWNQEMYPEMPKFFKKCMADNTISNRDLKKKNEKDKVDRTPLMAAATTGSFKNALLLIGNGCHMSEVSKYNESAIFYALKENHWEFLAQIQKMLERKAGTLKVREDDLASIEILKNRAIANDIEFFKNFFGIGIGFPEREILATSIKHNHTWLVENCKNIDSTFALHEACYYGKPHVVAKLMENKKLQVNYRDSNNALRTPLHVCHLSANYSEWHNGPRSNTKKEYIDPIVFNKYENNLIQDRFECFKILTGAAEITRRPDYKLKAIDEKTSYEQALNLHKYSIKRMQAPLHEISDSEQIERNKNIFDNTVKTLEVYHKDKRIGGVRKAFADLKFVRESFLYLLFLIILSSIGLMSTTNGRSDSYFYTNAARNHFLGPDFDEINNEEGFWDWMNQFFVPALYPPNDGQYNLQYNLILGATRLRQIKVRNGTCHTEGLFTRSVNYCYGVSYDEGIEDKKSFGPNQMWKWGKNEKGDDFWDSDHDWYSESGFIEDLPSNNRTIAEDTLTNLQENGWITKGTRMVVITFSLYNANLNGAFLVGRIMFKFSAVGDVVPTAEFVVLSSFSYDRFAGTSVIIKIIMELLFVIYFFYEFIRKEFLEMREAIEHQQQKYIQLQALGEAHRNNAILKGLEQYWKSAWNYYEWLMIFMFIVIVALRIQTIALFGGLNFNLPPTEYLYIHKQAFTLSHLQDLLSTFIAIAWFRMLKFLRILPFTGAMVQSLMDTLTSKAVVIFFFVIFYIILVFGLSFHMAFGTDVITYNRWPDSILTLFKFLFGDFDYETLYQSNKVFGPLFFVLFMLFTVFVLMNLLIGVLGEAYNSVQDLNEARWNRFITRLMIDGSHDKCKSLSDLPGYISNKITHFVEKVFSKFRIQNDDSVTLNSVSENEDYEKDDFDNLVIQNEGQKVFGFNEQLIMSDDTEVDNNAIEISRKFNEPEDEENSELTTEIAKLKCELEEKEKIIKKLTKENSNNSKILKTQMKVVEKLLKNCDELGKSSKNK